MVVIRNQDNEATHRDELERIADLAARGDLRTLVRLLSDYVHAHRDQLPPPVRDNARILLRKSMEVELNLDTLDPADLELARDRLQRQASKLLDILGNPEALALLEPSHPNGSPPRSPLGFATSVPADSERQRPPDRFAVIDAIGITRTYQSSAFSLQPIDVTVRPKQILTIIGINGSGKSTLIDILRGELAPDHGTVYYPLLSNDPHDWQTIRSKIGYVPTRSRSWRGTVRENLEYAAAAHRISGTRNTENVDYLIDRHGLKHYEARTWSELSSGYRLRFDLALARVHQPRLLILDEPMANLDLVSQQSLLFDLKQLAEQFETAIIITSQHLFEMEAIASTSIVLFDGRQIRPPAERAHRYFEIWPRETGALSADVVQAALADFAPDARIWLDATTCLVELPPDIDLAALAAEAAKRGLALAYVRDVSASARIEMDPRVVPPVREAEKDRAAAALSDSDIGGNS